MDEAFLPTRSRLLRLLIGKLVLQITLVRQLVLLTGFRRRGLTATFPSWLMAFRVLLALVFLIVVRHARSIGQSMPMR
ncbi:MAG: hypothetical protein BGO65_04235 [Afipia sp. 64-13]|nr:MAG: hypothetical protein BGO65_04235 [Afipia sp. 64-13]